MAVQGEAYQLYIQLVDANDTTSFKVDPTIVAGDFQISIDGGALANLTNLPAASPTGSSFVLLDLTAAETSGDNLNIVGIDQAGDEWQEVGLSIQLPTGDTDSIYNILRGDHEETSTRLIIYKAGTTEVVLDKKITGSLLNAGVTIRTTDT